MSSMTANAFLGRTGSDPAGSTRSTRRSAVPLARARAAQHRPLVRTVEPTRISTTRRLVLGLTMAALVLLVGELLPSTALLYRYRSLGSEDVLRAEPGPSTRATTGSVTPLGPAGSSTS